MQIDHKPPVFVNEEKMNKVKKNIVRFISFKKMLLSTFRVLVKEVKT